MSVLHINDTNFDTEVVQSSKPVLVDFWAPWCGPCRMMGPVVDELADDLADDAVVVKVNIDDAADAAARYGVSSIPTFAVFKDGTITQQFGGVLPKATLHDAVRAEMG